MNIQSETGLNSPKWHEYHECTQTKHCVARLLQALSLPAYTRETALIFEDFQIIIGLVTKNKKKSRANVNKHDFQRLLQLQVATPHKHVG